MNDEQALISALNRWFQSQDAKPSLAIPAMAKLCGALIGVVVKDKDDLQVGLDSFQTIVAHSAAITFKALHDR